MASDKGQQLAQQVADLVVEKQSAQFTDLKLAFESWTKQLETLKQVFQSGGTSGGTKKATKSKKNDGEEAKANGTAETKSEAKSTKGVPNSMNHFKNMFKSDGGATKAKYWTDKVDEEFKKDTKAQETFAKKKNDPDRDMARAAWYWSNKKTEAMGKEWAALAKAHGNAKSTGNTNTLNEDDK